MHSRTHYAQKNDTCQITSYPALRPLDSTSLRWGLRSTRNLQPASRTRRRHASPGLADRLTARGAEVQADGDGHITLLNLYWTDLTDDDLPLLGGLHQLRTLILPVRATTAGLRHLKGLTALAELYPPNEITDAGLAGLAHLPNLKELFLYGSKITDAGLVHFKPLQQLEFLGIQHTRVNGSGLIHLQGLQNLAWLDLSYTQIGDPELKQLQKLSQLKAVGLYGTQLSPDGIRKIQAALPHCTVLYR